MVQWLGFNTFTAMAPRLNPWSGNRSCKLHEAAPKKQESQERRCKTNKKPEYNLEHIEHPVNYIPVDQTQGK